MHHICCRTVQVVKPDGTDYEIRQTIYLKLTEAEANITSITEKAQEELDMYDNIVVFDSKGIEYIDSPGSRG